MAKVKISGKKENGLTKKNGSIIKEYSREARNRMRQELMSVDYEKNGLPVFYTLTYPGEYPRNPEKWKNDLRVLDMRMRRKMPEYAMQWKIEEQKRGAPHFCGLIWHAPWLITREGKKWFSRQWYEVVGSGDLRHLKAGTGLERVKNLKQIINYVAKYVSKNDQTFDYPVGRYWGWKNKAKLEIVKNEIEIGEKVAYGIKRVMKRSITKNNKMNIVNRILNHKRVGLWAQWDNKTTYDVLTMAEQNEERKSVDMA